MARKRSEPNLAQAGQIADDAAQAYIRLIDLQSAAPTEEKWLETVQRFRWQSNNAFHQAFVDSLERFIRLKFDKENCPAS